MDCGYVIYKSGSSDEPACIELTNKIKGSMYNIAKEFVYIGFLLAECDYFETYKEWGYSSIHEYASEQLGFKKSSTYNFINVCKTFSSNFSNNGIGCSLPFSMIMKDTYAEFNYSQLVEMLSMNDKQRSLVTPDMTVKQIRDVKKNDIDFEHYFNLNLKHEEFKFSMSKRIDRKEFILKVEGVLVQPSEVHPEGYFISYDISFGSSGSGTFSSPFKVYDDFVDSIYNHFDVFTDSRRLESAPEEAPAPDVPEEASAPEFSEKPEPEIFSYPGYDLLVPLKSDLHALFNSIEEAYLDINNNFDSDLFDLVFGYLKSNDYIICKKVNKKPKNRFALK